MKYEIVKSRTGLNCVFAEGEDYPIATIEKFSEGIYTVFLLNKKKKISFNINGVSENDVICSVDFDNLVK